MAPAMTGTASVGEPQPIETVSTSHQPPPPASSSSSPPPPLVSDHPAPPVSDFSSDAAAAHAANNAQRVIKRRAPVACRRCRRMRSKCIHSGAKPPCEGCRIAGVSLDECVFPVRGTPDLDREYRHPRMKGDKARKDGAGARVHQSQLSGGGGGGSIAFPLHGSLSASPTGGLGLGLAAPADPWDLLPPLDQTIDAVNMFIHQYFQLGFLPRHAFVQQLQDQPRSVSAFLLLSILSVSARMTPALVDAHGSAVKTAELFMERASVVAQSELYLEPTLTRCQAFFLLSLAQQGSGYRNRSFVNLGIALRMAILMGLHHEETYALDDAVPAMVQKAESARRTLWMLYSQDNLYASPTSPVSLAPSDITILLPSNEDDFENGVLPATRAALEGTAPAKKKPTLVSAPTRSLFATLMQSHQLWGIVSRRAVTSDRGSYPRHSDYTDIKERLNDWENHLPKEHLWSQRLLREYKAKSLDLAYVAVTMVTRLCNIIIRKAYIPQMLNEGGPKQHRAFWKTMSSELFSNIKGLFTQIDCWIQEREPREGTGAQLAVFCVYSCCLMAAYLCKYPKLCPDASYASEAKHMLERTKDILSQSTDVWPLARRWLLSVEKIMAADQKTFNFVPHEGGMAEGEDPIPSALYPPLTYSGPSGPSNTPFDDRRQLAKQLGPNSPHARSASPSANSMANNGHGSGGPGSGGINSSATAPRQPPQLRTNDSLLNSSMLLPPPHPSPGLGTTSTGAVHYGTAPSAPPLPPPLVLPPAAPTAAGLTSPPLPHHQQLQPQQAQQQQPQQPQPQQPSQLPNQLSKQQQPVSHHGLIAVPTSGPFNAVIGDPLGARPSGISPTAPPRPILPRTSQTHPDGDISMMVDDFNAGSVNSVKEEEAAAVLISRMMPHGMVSFPQSHQPHPATQAPPPPPHAAPYGAPPLPDPGVAVGSFPGSEMPVTGQLPPTEYYASMLDLPDDGYNAELQYFIQGPSIQAGPGTSWTGNMFDI